MAGAAVLVMPSRLEPFGIVALEGWRAGTAVVATRRGGAPEFVRDGEDGLLVDPFDTAAVARVLGRLLSDETLRRSIRRRPGTGGGVRLARRRRPVPQPVPLAPRIAGTAAPTGGCPVSAGAPAGVRVGVDLVDVGDVADAVGWFGDRYVRRIYTDHEITCCRRPGDDGRTVPAPLCHGVAGRPIRGQGGGAQGAPAHRSPATMA